MELTENQKEIFTKVLAEAWENVMFKEELIKSPQKAIENLTGEQINLKEGIKMVVVDQTENDTFYFNIPQKSNFEDMELSEEQLEIVSGGGDFAKGMFIAGIVIEETFHFYTGGFFR